MITQLLHYAPQQTMVLTEQSALSNAETSTNYQLSTSTHAGPKRSNLAWLVKFATNSEMRSFLARSRATNYGPQRNFVIDEKNNKFTAIC